MRSLPISWCIYPAFASTLPPTMKGDTSLSNFVERDEPWRKVTQAESDGTADVRPYAIFSVDTYSTYCGDQFYRELWVRNRKLKITTWKHILTASINASL